MDSNSDNDVVEIPVIEDDDDRKPAARKKGPHVSKQSAKELLAITMEKTTEAAEAIMQAQITKHELADIGSYIDIIKTAVPREFSETGSATFNNDVEKNLLESVEVRKGLRQMVNICVAVVDIFCACGMDMFTGSEFGITRCIQLVMSKFE